MGREVTEGGKVLSSPIRAKTLDPFSELSVNHIYELGIDLKKINVRAMEIDLGIAKKSSTKLL